MTFRACDFNAAFMTFTCLVVIDSNEKISVPALSNILMVIRCLIHLIQFKSCSFYSDEPEELVNLQKKEWQPILQWFNEKYGILHIIVMLYLTYMYMYL